MAGWSGVSRTILTDKKTAEVISGFKSKVDLLYVVFLAGQVFIPTIA